jgi:hypothetical protein
MMVSTSSALVALRNLGGPVWVEDNLWKLELQVRAARDGTHVWLANEGAIDKIELNWRLPEGFDGYFPSDHAFTGDVLVHLVDGYEHLSEGLNRILARDEAGATNTFANKPFSGSAVMAALLSSLGVEPLNWCCLAVMACHQSKLKRWNRLSDCLARPDWRVFPPVA